MPSARKEGRTGFPDSGPFRTVRREGWISSRARPPAPRRAGLPHGPGSAASGVRVSPGDSLLRVLPHVRCPTKPLSRNTPNSAVTADARGATSCHRPPAGPVCRISKTLCRTAGARGKVYPEVVTLTRNTHAHSPQTQQHQHEATAHGAHSAHGDGTDTPVFDQAFWDDRYRSAHSVWSGRPNAHLISEVTGLTPGSALDIGCGEGADALWLAQQGWTVTAVDLSVVALERAAARAAEADPQAAARITWKHADITEWTPEAGAYDLVSSHYIHVVQERRGELHQRMATAAAPGGILLIVGHHPWDQDTTMPRPRAAGIFYTAEEVAAQLPAQEWTVLTEDARAQETVDHEGRPVTLHDAVLKARRSV
ncbi:class I SAM-dependent methyltransferase [Streptacidiphilus sp. 4-A2]|nr:class I SAM-dependent methyltransferase [Streptacidiphilus sp. 4-A2]